MSIQLCRVDAQKYCAIHQNIAHMKELELALGPARAASLPLNPLVPPASLAQPMKPTKSWEEEKEVLQDRKQEEDIWIS